MYSQKYWYLERFDVTTMLSKDEIIQMDKAMIIKKVDKNTIVAFPEMQENYVYFLKEGIIKIIHVSDEGDEIIKYLITSGNIFGEMALLENQESPNDYAIAVNDCVVCFMETNVLKMMMGNSPKMATYVRKLVGLRLRKIERRLESIILKDARTRICEFLIDFAKEYGKYKEDGLHIKNFLTHDDIAKITATSRQTVTSVLNDLRCKGILDYNSKELIISYEQVKAFLGN
ncbi:cyclic nucleotide-binding domain-containing protein [Runella sp. CRIBMP]|uniref:Crp/Fnr family transcriptional regulator n=1 Tax=Runella sp. CRIBMP TaxID=2683261 RepID=UPI001412D4D8|nr:Crp/Fnr family transcriptional regulator [Runella sp. CRIBMP]NBB23482.1 cyclic nucleotide-binding domain-containing protein [Runella sp. CRIBMP]